MSHFCRDILRGTLGEEGLWEKKLGKKKKRRFWGGGVFGKEEKGKGFEPKCGRAEEKGKWEKEIGEGHLKSGQKQKKKKKRIKKAHMRGKKVGALGGGEN